MNSARLCRGRTAQVREAQSLRDWAPRAAVLALTVAASVHISGCSQLGDLLLLNEFSEPVTLVDEGGESATVPGKGILLLPEVVSLSMDGPLIDSYRLYVGGAAAGLLTQDSAEARNGFKYGGTLLVVRLRSSERGR